MSNDKHFAIYALILIAGVTSVLAASVTKGVTAAPPPLMFLEHLALGLGFRAAYKAFAGWDNVDWPWQRDAVTVPAPTVLVRAAQPEVEAESFADAA